MVGPRQDRRGVRTSRRNRPAAPRRCNVRTGAAQRPAPDRSTRRRPGAAKGRAPRDTCILVVTVGIARQSFQCQKCQAAHPAGIDRHSDRAPVKVICAQQRSDGVGESSLYCRTALALGQRPALHIRRRRRATAPIHTRMQRCETFADARRAQFDRRRCANGLIGSAAPPPAFIAP